MSKASQVFLPHRLRKETVDGDPHGAFNLVRGGFRVSGLGFRDRGFSGGGLAFLALGVGVFGFGLLGVSGG